VAGTLLGLVVLPALGGGEATEYEVKAAFLYHFAQLVEWPNPLASDRPFVVALVGADPFGPVLDDVIGAQQVRGRTVRIERYRSVEALPASPQILFVGMSDGSELQRVLDAVARTPVLTIGELDRFAERGGMIGFRLTRAGRVTFDINRTAAERVGLKLSSQLLKLARIVEGPP